MTDQFLSLQFYAEVAVAIVAYRFLLPRIGRLAGCGLLIAISSLFIFSLQGSRTFLMLVIGYAVFFPLLGLVMARVGESGRGWLLWLGIGIAASVMLWFKYPTYSSWLFGEHAFLHQLSAINWIGLSYMTFRAIDLLLYAKGLRTDRLDYPNAVSYLLFFAPFVAGPINRFRQFNDAQNAAPTPLSPEEVRDAVLRISIGIFKIVVLARFFYVYALVNYQGNYANIDLLTLVIGVYAYLLYFYLDFSGYCDIAISVARLFRVPVPENFNFPFLARNMQDFWNRWHISLSHWCRDYIFFQLIRKFAAKFGTKWQLATSAFSIFVTFFFVGAWHGDAIHWIFYGVYHGFGLAIWLVFTRSMTRVVPELYARLQANPVYITASTVLTLSYVAWGLILVLGLTHAREILERIF